MNAILVDSNVLLDVIGEDSTWFEWSSTVLARTAEQARLVINPIIYAEVSVRFARVEDLEEALPRSLIDREHIPYEAAFLSGKVYLSYRRQGGVRTAPLPDFFIGAHAAIAGYRLLTRDAARYQTYFPKLTLISPENQNSS